MSDCKVCCADLDDYADYRRSLCSDCLFDGDGDLEEPEAVEDLFGSPVSL